MRSSRQVVPKRRRIFPGRQRWAGEDQACWQLTLHFPIFPNPAPASRQSASTYAPYAPTFAPSYYASPAPLLVARPRCRRPRCPQCWVRPAGAPDGGGRVAGGEGCSRSQQQCSCWYPCCGHFPPPISVRATASSSLSTCQVREQNTAPSASGTVLFCFHSFLPPRPAKQAEPGIGACPTAVPQGVCLSARARSGGTLRPVRPAGRLSRGAFTTRGHGAGSVACASCRRHPGESVM